VLLRRALGCILAVLAVLLALATGPVWAQTDPLFQDLLAAKAAAEKAERNSAEPVVEPPAQQPAGQQEPQAQAGDQPTDEAHAAAAAHVKALLMDKSGKMVDKTGTNPTTLRTTFVFFDEYRHLPNNDYFNITNLRMFIPFDDRKGTVRVTVPIVATNFTSPEAILAHGNPLYREPNSGLGDIDARATYIAYITPRHAVVAFLGATFDTASNDALGRGKNYLQPGLVFPFFFPKSFIFAPAYQHNVSFSGDSKREDINEGYIDLYMVKISKYHLQWLIIDPQIIVDYKHNNDVTGKLEIEMGAIFAKIAGGAASFYVRPGVGFGPCRKTSAEGVDFFVPYGSRPYDWNLQGGFKIIW
jgi:hypothetical protein